MAWKASWAHRTGENEKKRDTDKILKIGPNVEHLWFHISCMHMFMIYIYGQLQKEIGKVFVNMAQTDLQWLKINKKSKYCGTPHFKPFKVYSYVVSAK